MILVDSSVWITYFNGVMSTQTNYLDRILGQQLILMGDLILVEVLQGFRHDREFQRARSLLEGFPYQDMLGYKVASRSIEHYRTLRKKGVTIRKTIDALIATFCIVNGHTLLHNDEDFEPFVRYCGLKVLVT